MDPRYARYPFFEGAREAVREAELSPAALVRADAPAVERGRERVERALLAGTVASETPRRWDVDSEVLSYPIARILVSLLDSPAAVEKYAAAEATTASERFETDFAADDDPGSAGRARASLDAVLREFDLADAVRPDREAAGAGRRGRGDSRRPGHFRVGLGPYLDLADPGWGRRWRLVNREVAAGEVRVAADDLSRLLEAAVERRVAAGLPFEVDGSGGGDAIAEALSPAVADLRELLNDHGDSGRTSVEAVVPALFPPCMRTLVRRARDDGDDLTTTAEFSLTSFLVALGMDAEEVTTLLDLDGDAADRIGNRTEYLAERDGTQYPPPSCATMQAYGDCVDPDERCDTIAHPLSYYTDAVREAGDVRDWREAADGD